MLSNTTAQINPETPQQYDKNSNKHPNQFRKLNFRPRTKVKDVSKAKHNKTKRKNIVSKTIIDDISGNEVDGQPLISEEKHEIKIPTHPLAEVNTIGKQKVESAYKKGCIGRECSNEEANRVDPNIYPDLKRSRRRKPKTVTEKSISHQLLLKNFSNNSIKRKLKVYSKSQKELSSSNGLRIQNPAIDLYKRKNQKNTDILLSTKHLTGELRYANKTVSKEFLQFNNLIFSIDLYSNTPYLTSDCDTSYEGLVRRSINSNTFQAFQICKGGKWQLKACKHGSLFYSVLSCCIPILKFPSSKYCDKYI